MIKTENLKELARLQEITKVNLKDGIIHKCELYSNVLEFYLSTDKEGYFLNHKMKDDVFQDNSLKQILSFIEERYNEDLEKRVEAAKKAVWNDIAENSGI